MRPLNTCEQVLVDSLMRSYDKVEISRYDNAACDWENNGEYNISVYGLERGKIAILDSMRSNSQRLVTHIYTNCIEDTILLETPIFTVWYHEITFEDYKNHKSEKALYTCTYKKEAVAKFCGFEVKGNDSKTCKRISITKVDSLPVSEEHIYLPNR